MFLWVCQCRVMKQGQELHQPAHVCSDPAEIQLSLKQPAAGVTQD